MSVDTRTPRSGFDDQPPLSMLKVDSDPAQVIVNHASFRVKLATPGRTGPRRLLRGGSVGLAVAETALIPAMSDGRTGAATEGAGTGRRRAPVVWSGRSQPGDPGATGLLQAVRQSGSSSATTSVPAGGYGGYERGGRYDAGATQVIPRVEADDNTRPTPTVGGGGPGTPLLPPMRRAVGAYDAQESTGERDGYGYGDGRERPGRAGAGEYGEADGYGDDAGYRDGDSDTGARVRIRPGAARAGEAVNVRHAYYPGRRMNLGVVLLPLRVFLGCISIYAGMGKLSDPVYFDGGERGSMMKWLNSLHPWALAEPLRDFALSHPVGAGLSVAFLQIVAGVLTVLGLWQRIGASLGAVLSAALLVTVSWRTVPAYDAPDFIYLAAWSPLIIAGAPVYSVDGKLAGEAWRKLGPRSGLWDLRRYVLRRGTIVATVVIGLTLLVGSVLGGAVRSSGVVTVPGPNHDPVNQLPGEPLPGDSASRSSASSTPNSGHHKKDKKDEVPSGGRSKSPSADGHSAPGATTGATESGSHADATQGGMPTRSQSAGGAQAPSQTTRQQAPSAAVGSQGGSGGSSAGGTTGGSGTPGGSGTSGGGGGDTGGGTSSGGSSSGGPSSGGEGSQAIGGLLG